MEYVKNVQPEFMELFVKRAPQQVPYLSHEHIQWCYGITYFIFHGHLMEMIYFFMPTAQVVDAMRQTVTNMIGTLPPQFFAVTVTTVSIVTF